MNDKIKTTGLLVKIGGPINKDREDYLRNKYFLAGWKHEVDDVDLTFSFLEDEEHEWMHIYNRNNGRFLGINGRQQVALVSEIKKDKDDSR